MRFVLLVEGPTEARALPPFLKPWLDPQLEHPVGIVANPFDGVGDYLKNFARTATRYLEGPGRAEIVAVVGLIDLYAAPLRFPAGLDLSEKHRWAKGYLEDQVAQDGFRQFLAVHETEAWLLSDPKLFPKEVSRSLAAVCQAPESIDDQEPPAKLVDGLYRRLLRKRYKKNVDGPNLFAKLDPELVRRCCPSFRQMTDDMLALARARAL